jgi:hypothetical protein
MIHPFFQYMKIAPHLYGRQRPDYRQVLWQGGGACESRTAGPWQDAPCEPEAATALAEVTALLAVGDEVAAGETKGQEGLTPDQIEKLRALGYMGE